jgi:hypothetical protein
MKPDDFESQLQRQPLRGLPAEWRGEILSVVKTEMGDDEPGFWATLWQELFITPRKVWASMAAVWGVALVLNFASSSSAPTMQMATQPVETTQEVIEVVREQRRLRDELLGIGVAAVELSPADRPREGLKPRSERKEDYAVV